MPDEYGLTLAAERGVTLGDIGHEILQETDDVRVWRVDLDPGECIDFHFHHHPYVVVSLAGDVNEIESIFGDVRSTHEPAGTVVFRNAASPVHRLTNVSDVPYRTRLVEFKRLEWGEGAGLLPLGIGAAALADAASADAASAEDPPARTAAPESATPAPSPHAAAATADAMPDHMRAAFKEVLTDTDDLDWVDKSLAGLAHKALWRNEETGASISLVRFERGSGIPDAHAHASNQFMYCLSGRYRYLPTGTTLIPGSFYWNPVGSVHGPTLAEETTVLLEIYDGPHYPQRPSWYDNDADAQ